MFKKSTYIFTIQVWILIDSDLGAYFLFTMELVDFLIKKTTKCNEGQIQA